MRKILSLAGMVFAATQDVKVKRKAKEKQLKSTKYGEVVSTTFHAETEEFEVHCPKHDTDIITYLLFIDQNTLGAFQNKKDIVQLWGGNFNVLEPSYKGRTTHQIKALGTTLKIRDLTLDDAGFYFCKQETMGQGTTFSDLYELKMWAKPNNPVISMEPFLYSSDVRTNQTGLDYTQPQNVAQCTSTEGHPAPTLAFFDLSSGAKLTKDEDVECFPNTVRKEVQDCKLTLKFVVRKELDKNRYRCQMSHPSLREEKFRETEKVLRVHYPPHSLQISGNRTSRMITCNAIANPPPEYFYKIGKSGTLVKIADPKGKQYINELEKLPPNDVISCIADNKVAPKQTVQRQVEDIFKTEIFLSKTSWIIIGAAGGALILILIIVACCCCRRKNSKKEFKNNKKTRDSNYKKGHPTAVDMSQSNVYQPQNNATIASNASYAFRRPEAENHPKSNVEAYLRRAASKEALMDDYDKASSHPTDYMSHLQRSREVLNRSQEDLDRMGVDVTERELQPPHRADSFDDDVGYQRDYNPHAYNQPYYDDQDHLYANDPQHSDQGGYQDHRYQDRKQLVPNNHRLSYHETRPTRPRSSYNNIGYSQSQLSYESGQYTPPPPPRYESVNSRPDDRQAYSSDARLV